MANGLQWGGRIAAAGLLIALAAVPARAQFVAPGGFPLIAIPPPPAQAIVVPRKPKPEPAPAAQPKPASNPAAEPQITCRYQGQTRVCN